MEHTILLEKGTGKTAKVDEIGVPDLWHLGMWLQDCDGVRTKDHHHIIDREAWLQRHADMVLETWHLCHALLEHIKQS